MKHGPFSVACLASLLATPAFSQQPDALDILRTAVGFRTVAGSEEIPKYAEYLRSLLLSAGFATDDVRVERIAGTATLTARYPGRNANKKALLLIGHMDVVDARREDWQRDPFVAVVANGFVYGRGVYDNKFDVSMMVATLAKLKRSGWKPGREVILALSGDEETSAASAKVLATRLRGAELALNGDIGGGLLAEQGDAPVLYSLQGGEKTYVDFTLTVTDVGGHSSRPTRGNAIYRLVNALARLEAYEFPVTTNELTQAYFRASAPNTTGALGEAMRRYVANPADEAALRTLSADPEYVGQLRTTCVATQLTAGHSPNALPQRAVANVNCRVMPGTSAVSVQQTLTDVLATPGLSVNYSPEWTVESPTSPLRADVLAAVTKAVRARYPRVPVVPSMSAGATDGAHYRAAGVPTYGVSAVFIRSSDKFQHGLDERVPVAAIDGALAQWESVLRDLAR